MVVYICIHRSCWVSFRNGRGVCFFSLALTRSLLNDRFALRTMRGFSGNKLYSNGSFSTSSQISLRVCLTSGMCPLYVRDKKGVLGSGFVCSFFLPVYYSVSVFKMYFFDKWFDNFFVVSSRQERPFKFPGLFIEVCFICVSPEEPVCFT